MHHSDHDFLELIARSRKVIKTTPKRGGLLLGHNHWVAGARLKALALTGLGPHCRLTRDGPVKTALFSLRPPIEGVLVLLDAQPVERDVGHQVPLDDLCPLVPAELPEDLPRVGPHLAVDDFAPILRREHDVVLAHPLRVRRAVGLLGHTPPPPPPLGFPAA